MSGRGGGSGREQRYSVDDTPCSFAAAWRRDGGEDDVFVTIGRTAVRILRKSDMTTLCEHDLEAVEEWAHIDEQQFQFRVGGEVYAFEAKNADEMEQVMTLRAKRRASSEGPAVVDADDEMQGYLTKQGKVRRSWKRRYFVLKKGRAQLLYFDRSVPDVWVLKGVVNLRNYVIERDVAKPPQVQGTLFILRPNGSGQTHRPYHIQADNAKTADAWIAALDEVCKGA